MRDRTTFTTTWLDRLKPPAAEEQYTEPGYRGLILRVFPTGDKTFAYRYRVDGKRRLIALGSYPALTLAEAHAAFEAKRKLVASGIDPLDAAVAEKKALETLETVKVLVDNWQRLYCDLYRKRPQDARALLKANLPPAFLAMKGKEVTRRHVFKLVLDPITERGSTAVANDMASLLKQIFDFALNRGELTGNPLSGLKKQKERKRKRTLSDSEISIVWNRLNDCAMSTVTRLGSRFLLTTGKRVGEMVGATWRDMDMERKVWTVTDSKNGLDYLVPLTPLALGLLHQLKALAKDSDFVLPSFHRKAKQFGHMTERAYSQAIRENQVIFSIPHFTPHDFRRTMRTNMSRLRVPTVVAESCIGHKKKGTDEVYDLWEYFDEKVEAMTKWSDHIQGVIAAT